MKKMIVAGMILAVCTLSIGMTAFAASFSHCRNKAVLPGAICQYQDTHTGHRHHLLWHGDRHGCAFWIMDPGAQDTEVGIPENGASESEGSGDMTGAYDQEIPSGGETDGQGYSDLGYQGTDGYDDGYYGNGYYDNGCYGNGYGSGHHGDSHHGSGHHGRHHSR